MTELDLYTPNPFRVNDTVTVDFSKVTHISVVSDVTEGQEYKVRVVGASVDSNGAVFVQPAVTFVDDANTIVTVHCKCLNLVHEE